jgi:uncharacterized membrane protein YjgN (DUF898 family)
MKESLPYSDVSDASEHRYSTALGSSKLRFEFTGTGAEYFKIWLVNLLLTLITLGLYHPWAKVRRLQYFYANTQFDGDALAYDGKPTILARGYGLLAVMAGMVGAASWYSKTGGAAVLLVLAALAPGLLHASRHYQLRHTSWRGLRFGFAGTLKNAYQATLPLSGTCGVVLALALLTPMNKTPPTWLGYCAVALGIICLGIAPWLVWNFKQYQHKHFTLGTLKSRFKARAPDYFRLFLQIYLFAASLISIATSLAVDWLATTAPAAGRQNITAPATLSTTALLYLGAVALTLWLLVRPFATSRLQNVAWTQTGNSSLRCVSLLRYRALVLLGLKNSLLTVATLGLYWPFAAVATARLRIESVRVKTRVDPNVLVSSARPAVGKASAERSKKFLGLAIGL